MKEEYRCYNFTEKQLKLAYCDKKEPASQTCKEKYLYLFPSVEEFLQYYAAETFMNEVRKRESIYAKYQEEDAYLKSCIGNKKKKMKFQGCQESTDDMASLQGHARQVVLLVVSKKLDMLKPFYVDELIKKCFAIDADMSKEYEKNGSFFNTKRAFFESYTSSSYKTDLKNAKKSKK
jgi:hypothetical protein